MEQLRNSAREGLGRVAVLYPLYISVIHVEHSHCTVSAPHSAFLVDVNSYQVGLAAAFQVSARCTVLNPLLCTQF